MNIVSIVGARPQFIKLAPLSKVLRENHNEVIIHTGQHYDANMSAVFFEKLNIPKPDINLSIGSSNHGKQTGEMLIKLEEQLIKMQPDFVIVFGDTNTTLAGALAASKLNIKLAHIEAGLRSFNKKMPEEKNRILTDHLSDILFCPTENAVENLKNEGIKKNVYQVGDIMYDSVLCFSGKAAKNSNILKKNNISQNKYFLATIHRAENTDNKIKLSIIFNALNELELPVLLPLHPRTENSMNKYQINKNNFKNINFISPVEYLEMLDLVKNSKKVLTDSGGLQKEAYFLDKLCITLRDETEWEETLKGNWNVLAKINKDDIINKTKIHKVDHEEKKNNYFGDGKTALRIINILNSF